MAQTGEDFSGAALTLPESGTPAGGVASTAAIVTPATLLPPSPGVALSEVRSLPFNTDHEVSESDESGRAAAAGEGTSSRRSSSRGVAEESDIGSGQSTGTAALDATGRDEPGRGAPDSQPEEPLTKAVLLKRTEAMFLLGKGRLRLGR